MLAHLLLVCVFSLIPGLVQVEAWTSKEYPNPMVNPRDCKRGQEKSYLCDPDEILDKLNADQLDRELQILFNQTQCQCTKTAECRGDRRGFRLGIALMKRMGTGYKVVGSDDQAQDSMNNAVNDAQLFAYHLLTQWNLGRCGDDMILLYSSDDNVIFTFTGEVTEKFLSPSVLTEITMRERHKIKPKGGDILGGLLNIVKNYKKALNGEYKRVTFARQKAEAQAARQRQGSGGTEVTAAVLVTSIASLMAALALHW